MRTPSASSVGDRRFRSAFERVKVARDRAEALGALSDEETIQALAAASRAHDPYLANVLATEAMNRIRRSRTLAEHLGEGAFAVDAHLRITFVNPAMARLLGRPWGEIVGAAVDELFRFADETGRVLAGTMDCPVVSAARLGRTRDEDGFLLLARGGEPVPTNVLAAPILIEGEPHGAVVAVRDLTEERKAQAEIAALRDKLLAALATLPHGAIIIEADARISYANQAARDQLGVSVGESLRDVYARWQPRTWDGAPLPGGTIAEHAMRTRLPILGARTILRHPSGRDRYVQVNAVPLAQGGVAASYIDRTEARERAARAESLFRNQPEPTFFIDREGRITDVNPAVEALLRVDEGALRGVPFIQFIQPHEMERAAGAYASVLAGQTTDGWFALARPDGSRFRARVQSIPMRIDHEIVGVHGVVKEVEET